MRRSRAWMLAGSLLFAGCDGGESASDPDARPDPEAEIVERGEGLYRRYCALCHGRDGRGYAADDAPALGGQEFLRTATDVFLTTAIERGRPGTPMSAWSRRSGGPLDTEDISSILRYMRSWQRDPNVDVSSVRVQGNVMAGRQVYIERCMACHGARGEGVDAVALANPLLLATASDGFLQYAITHGRRGTRMPAFEGSLTPRQIDDTVAYVRSLANATPSPSNAQQQQGPNDPRIPPLSELEIAINPDGPVPRFTLRSERFVPAAEVQREMARGARMIILDARATSDWLSRRITGALPMPFYNLESAIDEHLPRDGTWMLAYCGCPHAASGRVVDALRAAGFTNTAIIDEGIHHWEEQGYPTETGLPAPGH